VSSRRTAKNWRRSRQSRGAKTRHWKVGLFVAKGETPGVFSGVVPEFVAGNLTMPTTEVRWFGTPLRFQMDDEYDDVEGKSYAEKQRAQYETRDMGEIMSRFFRAVSWKNNGDN
jgi:hypothetical protein